MEHQRELEDLCWQNAEQKAEIAELVQQHAEALLMAASLAVEIAQDKVR